MDNVEKEVSGKVKVATNAAPVRKYLRDDQNFLSCKQLIFLLSRAISLLAFSAALDYTSNRLRWSGFFHP